MIGIKKLHQFSLLVSAIALTGCGGQSDDGSLPVAPPSDPTPMLAVDGFSTVAPDVETFIDLRPFLRGNDVRITEIQADEDNALCGVPTVNGLGVNVEVKDGTFCQFTYTATQSGAPLAKASMNVLATKATEPTLPPISQAMVAGAGNATFDLQALLGSSWKGTYELNGDSVQVQGIEGNLGSETVTNNSIVFTPPELSGWNRIVFILDDTAAPSESVMGVIYVTISEKVNQPPTISVAKYPYQFVTTPFDKEVSSKDIGCPEIEDGGKGGICSADKVAAAMGSARTVFWENKNGRQNIYLPQGEKFNDTTVTVRNHDSKATSVWDERSGYVAGFVDSGTGQRDFRFINGYWWVSNDNGELGGDRVYASETLKVDLTKLSGLRINDPEGQDWKLVSVHSWTADVKPFDSDSVFNKAFNFTASRVGEHYVTYVVSDHYGGYSSGMIRINVTSKGGAPTWSDIETNGTVYKAPQTYAQASSGYIVSDVWDEAVNNTVAGYTINAATNYCSTIGALPSPTEMTALLSGPADELAAWPKGRAYIVSDRGTPKSFDLSTGTTAAYNPASVYYTTCIPNRDMQLEMLANTFVANGDTQAVAKVTMPTIDDTFLIEKVDGTLSEIEADISEGLKEGAVTHLTTSSTRAGTYRFRVSNTADPDSTLMSSTILYIGDKNTAQFAPETGLRVIKHGVVGDRAAVLVATVTDVNGNPVRGVQVQAEPAVFQPFERYDDKNNTVVTATFDGNNITNSLGQVHLKVTSNRFIPQLSFRVSANPTPGRTIKSQYVVFSFTVPKYPCYDGIPDNYTCIPVIDERGPHFTDGTLYAAPPSYESMAGHSGWSSLGFNRDTVTGGPIVIGDRNAWNAFCHRLSAYQLAGRTNWEISYSFDLDTLFRNYSLDTLVSEYGWARGVEGKFDEYHVYEFDTSDPSVSLKDVGLYSVFERRVRWAPQYSSAYGSCKSVK